MARSCLMLAGRTLLKIENKTYSIFIMKITKVFLVATLTAGYFFIAQAQSVKIEQLEKNMYAIAVTESISSNKLYWNTKPDSWRYARPLTLNSNQETVSL